jgi:hypothetical protein
MLLLGVAAGFVWERLANPAEWEVRGTGIVLTEAASKGQFSVVATYVFVGAVASLLLGWFTAWAARDLGWMLTPFIIGLTVIAAVIAWRLGVHLGPPDPSSVKGASVGDRIPSELAVNGFTPFLTWPIFGLVGLIGSTFIGVMRVPVDERPLTGAL